MSDSLERLYQAVIAAKDLDPAISRTARLFQRGPAKMAKKLAEEAIEVVIDAVNGKTDAVVRESADLLYNLTVLWASAGVKPEDVWREMAAARASARHCREAAEIGGQAAQGNFRKFQGKFRQGRRGQGAAQSGRDPGGSAANCRAGRPQPAQAALIPSKFPLLPAWTNPLHDGSCGHAETDLRLVHRRR